MATTWNPADKSPYHALSNGNLTAAANGGITIGIAVDFTHSKIWFYSPTTGNWNNAVIGSQNPVGNVGGLDISGLTSGSTPVFPAVSHRNAISKAKCNFGASSFVNTMPVGYSSWNTLASATVTLNPSDKDANITLSSGNLASIGGSTSWHAVRATNALTAGLAYFEVEEVLDVIASFDIFIGVGTAAANLASFIGADTHGLSLLSNGSTYTNSAETTLTTTNLQGFWTATRATTSKVTSGKWYFEIQPTSIDAGGHTSQAIGIANATFAPNQTVFLGEDANGIGAGGDGTIKFNNSSLATAASYPVNDVFGVAVDLDHGHIWFYAPTPNKWNNAVIGSQNPVGNVGGFDISTLTGAVFPVFASAFGDNTVVLNTGATTFAHTIPTGFSAWDATSNTTAGKSQMFFGGD